MGRGYLFKRATGGAVASFPRGKALVGGMSLLVLFSAPEKRTNWGLGVSPRNNINLKHYLMIYKAMYKSELARLAGVSSRTFARYLATRRQILSGMGVSQYAQMLPPRAVKYVSEDYCIDLPEEIERLKHIKFV